MSKNQCSAYNGDPPICLHMICCFAGAKRYVSKVLVRPCDTEATAPSMGMIRTYIRVGLTIATTLRKLSPKDWDPKRYDTLLLHKAKMSTMAKFASVYFK